MPPNLAILWFQATAGAHVGAPIDAIDVQIGRTDSTAVAVEASVGLFQSADREDWRWTCHEAVTTAEALTTPRYVVAGSTWLAVVRSLSQSRDGNTAVYRSTDLCTWTAASGLDGHEIEAIALSTDGVTAWAVSDDPGTNSVYRSDDGGISFDATTLSDHPGGFTSVLEAEGESAATWTASVDSDGRLWVHRTLDLGETWTTHEVSAEPPEAGTDLEIAIAAVHPDDADTAWVRLDYLGADRVLRTTDGGESFIEVLVSGGEITDTEVGPDGDVWVAVSGRVFMYAADGGAFNVVETAPPGLGVRVVGDEVWLATRFEMLNSALSVGTEEAGFGPLFTFYEVDGPISCPAGSEGADICEPLYGQLLSSLGIGGDTGSGSVDSGSGDNGEPRPNKCGCDGGGTALLLPLPLLLGLRRRRLRGA